MIVCFDIGGTAIKGALATSPEDIRPFPRQPTPIQDFDAFVATLASIIAEAEALAGKRAACIAISIAGVIDPDTTNAVVASIHGRPLQADLETALGLPVIVANDADCFVLAEAGIGAARGHRVVFGVILGTGVGGGLVIDGKLINESGFAGEWGHGPIQPTEAGSPPIHVPRFQCGCGQVGCIDAVCSARGLEKLHKHIHGEHLTSEQIITDWQKGDAMPERTIDVYVDILTDALSVVVNVTGTTILPVGGGLSNVAALLARIDTALRARILRKFKDPIVVPAACGVEPGLIGAAILGLDFAKGHKGG